MAGRGEAGGPRVHPRGDGVGGAGPVVPGGTALQEGPGGREGERGWERVGERERGRERGAGTESEREEERERRSEPESEGE